MNLNLSTLANYAVIVVYTAVVVGISVFFSREKKNSVNYLLGGRSMPAWAIGLACQMSLFSSISIVVGPGEVFNHSLTYQVLGSFLLPFMMIPCYMLFARFYFKLSSFTPYEYLEYRYDKSVRAIIAFTGFQARLIYIGTVLYTSAKIFQGAFHWPVTFSILLVALVGIASSYIGGSKAIVWTDVFQAFITFGGLGVVAFLICWKIDGGIVEGVRRAFADGHGLNEFAQAEFYHFTPYIRVMFWMLLWQCINAALNDACSDQVAIQRYLSCKNWWEGLKSQFYSFATGMFFSALLYLIGLVIYTYYQQFPDPEIGPQSGDTAVFHFVSGNLPAPFSGLFMAAMLAAIMSTVSGVSNSMAGVWVKEFHSKFINKHMDEAKEFSVLRKATLVIGAIGVCFALGLNFSGKWLNQSAVEVGTIFGLLGGAVIPAYIFGVLSCRASAKLVWGATFFGIGSNIASNTWYALSRKAVEAFNADPSVGMGWGGKLDFVYVWPWFVAGAAIVALVLLCKAHRSIFGKALLLLAMMSFGAFVSMVVWWIFSNALVDKVPLERSFAFALPLPLLFSFVALWFFPKQPREKWQGMTIRSFNEPIICRSQSGAAVSHSTMETQKGTEK